MLPSTLAVCRAALGKQRSLGIQPLPALAQPGLCRPGQGANTGQQHGGCTNCSMLLTELPWGRAWVTSLFPWEKPFGLLAHAMAGSQNHGVEGCLSPSLPSLPPWRSCSALSWHFIPQKSTQWVGCSGAAEGAGLCWLPGSLQNRLFLAFHLAACARIPNPLQPLACAPRGAARHVLLTLRASHPRQRMKSEACKYV